MQLAQIRLQSQPARLALSRTPPKQMIEQQSADFSIEQPKPDLQIQRTSPKLTIDQSQAWSDMNRGSIMRAMDQWADEGEQSALQAIAEVAADGDELMMIENGGDVIIAQSARKSEPNIYDWNIAWIPSPGSVKIHIEPGETKIDWQVNKPIIQAQINKTVHEYTPGKAEAYIEQYQSLQVDFANLKYVGVNFEMNI
ncbi:hypothetical protein EJF36_18095 [Bacillus sp. HMF5848]|uniref:DUF6470 family protein n=1 Tax=Bacillus sp. HMF5848 TaxID=2495421 RepID=UPI000F7B5F02|nr:DUF6470 family protein [Bacillus sp. HMF5848]RSK28622.1 hypothetical protein EJF36_18095 [Bacillus sp. HMF5848]